MEFSKHDCIICKTTVEVPKMMLEVFEDAEAMCPKCNKAIKIGGAMTTTVVNTDYNATTHPIDPRPDLKEDAKLWGELLKRLWTAKKELYYTFHGLRCAGSKLHLKNDKIEFVFSDEFKSDFIKKVREENLAPHKDVIEIVMNRLAKDMLSEQTLDDCPF